jgi:hypothetical protein
MQSNSNKPWTPFESMASRKRNFGRPPETLDVVTKLWTNFFKNKSAPGLGKTIVSHGLEATEDSVATFPECSLFFFAGIQRSH